MKKRIFLLASLLMIPVCKAADDKIISQQELEAASAEQNWQKLDEHYNALENLVKTTVNEQNWEKMDGLIKEGIVDVNKPFFQQSLLSAFDGNLELIERFLLNKGSDPTLLLAWTVIDARNDKNKTITPLIKLLLDSGADYHSKDVKMSLDEYYTSEGKKQLLDLFEKYKVQKSIKG